MHYVEEEAFLKAQAEFRDYEREYMHVEMLVHSWAQYKKNRTDDLWGKLEAYLDVLRDDLQSMQEVFHSITRYTGVIKDFDTLITALTDSENSLRLLKSYLDHLPLGKRSEDTVVVAYHITIMKKDLERLRSRLRYPYISQFGKGVSVKHPDLAIRCANAAGAIKELKIFVEQTPLETPDARLALDKAMDDLALQMDLVLFAAGKIKK